MPPTNQKKVKCSYHTDSPCEEHMKAAKCDVKLYEIPIRIAATLHDVRPKLCLLKLTSVIIRFLMEHCGITCMGACTRRWQMKINRSFPLQKRRHLWIGSAIRLPLQSHLIEKKSAPSCSTSLASSL